MANELTIIDGTTQGLPAYLKARTAGRVANVKELSLSVPSITIAGKVFSINRGSEKIKLVSKNADGDEIPLSILPVVILGYNEARGRSYYEGGYDQDNPKPPNCWSKDSVKPDDSVETPVSSVCNGCKFSIKGSGKTDNGEPTVACKSYRLLSVVPTAKVGQMEPLRLRLAQTSDYDGQSKELQAKGMFAFSNYLSYLKSREIMFTDAVSTKLSFDVNKPHPKLLFRADQFLTDEQYERVESYKAEDIAASLHEAYGGAAPGDVIDDEGSAGEIAGKPPTAANRRRSNKASTTTAEPEKPADPTPKETPATKPVEATAAAVEEDEDDRLIREANERKAAKAAEAAKAAAKAAETAKASAGNGTLDLGGAAEEPAAAKPASPATKPVEGTEAKVTGAVADMLNEWG